MRPFELFEFFKTFKWLLSLFLKKEFLYEEGTDADEV